MTGAAKRLARNALLAVLVALPTAAAAQSVPPPDAAQLAPGYHLDADGCVGPPPSGPMPPRLPPDDPQVRSWYAQYPAALAAYRAEYAESQGDLLNAVALRRRELRASTDSEAEKDAAIRLPLSIDLVRLGNMPAARRMWTDLLKRLPAYDKLVFTSGAHRRLDVALESFRLDDSINPAFEDSGAAAHLERGVSAANHHDLDRAAAEWRLAIRCSPQFGWPHLLLGVAEELHGKRAGARAQWLDTLGSDEPQPPGPRFIDPVKYEAMRLLIALDAASYVARFNIGITHSRETNRRRARADGIDAIIGDRPPNARHPRRGEGRRTAAAVAPRALTLNRQTRFPNWSLNEIA